MPTVTAGVLAFDLPDDSQRPFSATASAREWFKDGTAFIREKYKTGSGKHNQSLIRDQIHHEIAHLQWRVLEGSTPTASSEAVQAYIEKAGITQASAVALNGGLRMLDGLEGTATCGLYGIEFIDAGDRHRVYVLHDRTDVVPVVIDRKVTKSAFGLAHPEDRARWRELCTSTDPRLVDDPHYPALAAALTRADQAGNDVATLLSELATSLPAEHPGRELHTRLISLSEAAATPPARPQPAPTAPVADRRPARRAPSPPPAVRPPRR